jgi:probable F420-dependent oxidoreductase
MRFTLQYPLVDAGYAPELLAPDVVTRVAQAAEEAGFDALAFTEHPAPSAKWMNAGGHEALDPPTALAFCAAGTRRIRLVPYLMVLPYRSPFLAAKQLATLDRLSGGRVVAAVGAGYLRSEFAALGVDFAARNTLLDEGVEAMRGIWTTDGWSGRGLGFLAPGQTARPRPLQQPHPPIWVGGNGKEARRRVVEYGAGWAPLILGEEKARTVRTPALPDVAALRTAIADLHSRLAAAGRDPAEVEVQIEWKAISGTGTERGLLKERLGELAEAGVTSMVVDPPCRDVVETLEHIAAYGAEVVASA